MEKYIKYKAVCTSCYGTGIYQGMSERDGAGVVCSRCRGTGCEYVKTTYVPFKKRIKTDKIKRVFISNVGIMLGEIPNVCTLEDFGGMPYKDWEGGEPFPEKSEDRQHTCPLWWYQTVDAKVKPDWSECLKSGFFNSCPVFMVKTLCWKRWDKEFGTIFSLRYGRR